MTQDSNDILGLKITDLETRILRHHYGDICLYLDNEKHDCTTGSVEANRFNENRIGDLIFWSPIPQHSVRKGVVEKSLK